MIKVKLVGTTYRLIILSYARLKLILSVLSSGQQSATVYRRNTSARAIASPHSGTFRN